MPTRKEFKILAPSVAWTVLVEDYCVHVIPIEDKKPHGFPEKGNISASIANLDCPCGPKIDFRGSKPIVVHNSFEEKEFLDNLMDSYK